MFASSSRMPDLKNRGKRKWTSNENLGGEDQEVVETDILQTPQNKRARGEHYHQVSQEASTSFERVFTWMKEKARKTARIITSFRDRFWRDDLEHEENEIRPPAHVHTDMQKHRHSSKDELRVTHVQDEETPGPSRWRRQPDESFSQYRYHKPSISTRGLYNPSKYSDHTTTSNDEFYRPVSSARLREDRFREASGEESVIKIGTREMKPKPPRNMTAFNIKQHPTTVDNVVRLQEREQYMKLLAHYTSSTNHGSVRRKPIVEVHEDEKKAVVTSRRKLEATHSVLSSESHSPRLSAAQKESRQPAAVKVQASPLKISSGVAETSLGVAETLRVVSAGTSKGILDLQPSNRSSRRSFDLLDDNWIKKWKETLSTDYLERQRKIAKEKLKLDAIRKEKDDFELVSQQVKERMQGKRESPVIEKEPVDTFQELTDEMNAVIDKALGHGSPNELLVELPIGRITRGDIITLRPQTWLNDEVVNAYFHMIVERSKNSAPKVHAFNTFFYPKLMKTGHASVRRWTKKVDLFAMDIVLIPVHLGMHWCLAVIDVKRKTFTYYDSLKGDNPGCIQAMRDYICAESLDKKKTNLDLTGWKNDSPKSIPEQLNGCDCGVFACMYAEYVSRRAGLNFTQHNMPYFRRRMVYEILKKKLL